MLTLITGHSGTGKTTRVTECIMRDLAEGRRVYLVVPEQQTVSAERDMAALLPPSAPLTFEVVNFTRLADTVFRMYGGLAAGTCDNAVEQLTMWRTLVMLAPILHNHIEAEPKNVDKMRRIIGELRAMCMTSAMMREAATNSREDLHDKLEDYALIAATYHDLLSELAGDAADHLDRLAEILKAHPFHTDTRFYFDNFSSFTEQEYGVIDALLRHTELTITLCVPRHDTLQLSAAEVDGTRAALARIAARCGVEIKGEELTRSYRLTDPARDYVAEHLYRADYASLPAYTGQASEALRLVEASDPLDACDYIAADIRERIMHGGCRYQDFTVVCGSASSYAGLIDAAFEKYDIPFFFSCGQDMLTLEPVKMILLAYAVVSGDWRREDVIAYLKCTPSDIDANVRDELEIYSETWNIHGARWYDGVAWNMSPFGYGTPYSAGQRNYAAEKLARVNAARDVLIPPLSVLAEMKTERHSVAEHICALTEFLLALELPDHLDHRAEELKRHDRAAAAEYERLWNVLCDALDTMSRTLGDMTFTLEEFAAQLKMLFSAQKLGAIPANLDEVTVAEARMLRAGNVKYAYLLGANEGEFPPPPSADLAFTDAERVLLAELGTTVTDDTDARAARELYAFWRALNMASDGVTILWSRAGTSLEAVTPSDPVLRMRHLLGTDYPVKHLSAQDMVRAASTPAAAGECVGHASQMPEGAAMRRVLAETERYTGDIAALEEPLCNDDRHLSPSLASRLWQGDLAMTQSRVQKFKDCPFSYFCNYVLKLDNTERAEFNANSVGSFIHAILEYFFKLVREEGLDPHAIPPEKQAELLSRVEAHVIADTLPPGEEDHPRTRVLLKALAQSAAAAVAALCEEFSHSRFEPTFFELKIENGSGDNPTPVTFPLPDGNNIYIYGSIDRVDTYRDGENVYIRVVDYKTGTKCFKLDDITEGINLQLLLYLYAVLESDSPTFRARLGISEKGDLLPAAVLYLSSLTGGGNAAAPQTREEALRLGMDVPARSGLVLDDRAIIDAMDDTAEKDYLPISFKKDGEYTKTSLKSLTDITALGELKKKIGDILSTLGAALKGGDATAAPMKRNREHGADACQWCSYKAICRYTAPDKKKQREGGQIKTRPDVD